jgi:aldehyde dehydrogenase (NAD+)
LDISFRREALTKLYKAIESNSDLLKDALKKDLGKSSFESDMCEIRLTLSEITYQIKHIKKFSKERTVYTPL